MQFVGTDFLPLAIIVGAGNEHDIRRFDNESYKKRGSVKRFFGWLKLGLGKSSRDMKCSMFGFTGLILIAALILIWRKIWF